MISIVIPFHNEEENLKPLFEEIINAMKSVDENYEIIFVDDGSIDGSYKVVNEIARDRNQVKLIRLHRRFGKGEALSRGTRASRGEKIIFMDADLQDNPSDIPRFVKELADGYDFVNGVRQLRTHSKAIKLYSKMANNLLQKFAHSPFTDVNCGFKAFKREILDDIVLYANNFRFLPLAVYKYGYRVTEIPVENRPRTHGQSKFGAGKAIIGIFDGLTAYFLYQFSERPIHFFGFIGGIFLIIGSIFTVELIIERIFFHVLLYRRPLFQLGMFLIIVGIQIIMTGIIGELIVYLQKKTNNSSR